MTSAAAAPSRSFAWPSWLSAGDVVAAVAGREREVRDTLWLLLTLTFVLAPHVVDLPSWCAGPSAR